MKNKTLTFFLYVFIFILLAGSVAAQTQQDTTATRMSVVVKNDGTEFIGVILSQDAREVLIETKTVGQVLVPKHEIKEIRNLMPGEFSATGVYTPDEVFATRYFITTNGLPIKKGESYIQWNWYGPDMQFGVGKNFGVGIMTTWVAVPIVFTAKYSIQLSEKSSLGLGTLLGTGSWSMPKFTMAVPFAALTFGDRKANVTFSAGYGSFTGPQEQYDAGTQTYTEERVRQSRALLSCAFMFKVGRKVSFVFDSIIVPPGEEYTATYYNYDMNTGQQTPYQVQEQRPALSLFVPGIRYQMDAQRAFQFGFAGVSSDGSTIPIPMIQWYRKL